MANTNAQAIAFDNTRIRPFASQLYGMYLTAKSLVTQFNAQNIVAVIPNDSVIIADGAATDGRPQITDAQATNIITRAQELVNWMEEGLVASPFGTSVTNATLNTVAGVQVNGVALF